jgi:hypothetical protein
MLIEKLTFSRKTVEKMLLCFPDYGKCAPEYIAAMVATFSYYSEGVQERLASVQHGLVSKHSYIPSIADARALGDEFKGLEAAVDVGGNIKKRIKVYYGTPQWDAWQKIKSTPCVDMRDSNGFVARGWSFPTEFP